MNLRKKNIIEKIHRLPESPGVYQFLNLKNKIIYIGKAKNINKRVKSYFQNIKNQSPKNIVMLKHIVDFEWILVRSEVEALITEANLIKRYRPKYNIDLRDDKSFPYIKITKEPFPQVLLIRKVIKDGSKYFGPFTDVKMLRNIMKAIRKAFPI
jgi:excinuclease ABC subunit C